MHLVLGAWNFAGFWSLAFGVCLVFPISALAAHPDWQIGVAKIDITPDYPIRLTGYAARKTESEGIAQHLWAKALAIGSDRDKAAILISVDNCGVPLGVRDEVAQRLWRKRLIQSERLAICSTHTHSAPWVKGFAPNIFGGPIAPTEQTRVECYTRELTDALEAAALKALEDRKPARMTRGLAHASFAANRRTKGGPVDQDLPVLFVTGMDGKVRAVFATYACHCTTLGAEFNQLCGDWAGYAQEDIEREYPGAVALIALGCAGDANPNPRPGLELAKQHGQEIAAGVASLRVQSSKSRALRPVEGKLVCRMERIKLFYDTNAMPTRAEWEARARETNYAGSHARLNLARLDRGEKLPTSFPYLVQTWTFGDNLAMVFLAGEVVVDYSLRLKQEFDASRLWINAYANDVPCYIPSERVLKEGGYEGGGAMIYYDKPTRLAPGTEDRIIETVHKLVPKSFFLGSSDGPRLTGPTSPARLTRPTGLTAQPGDQPLSPALKVGAAEIDITAPIGHRMAGYFDERLATGVHDPLKAKAIILQQGKENIALVACDLVGLSLNVTSNARAGASQQTGIPVSNIVICATHSHTGPLFDDVRRYYFHQAAVAKDGNDPQETIHYPDFLIEQLVKVISQAHSALHPAQLSVGIARQQNLTFNRRYWMKNGKVAFNPGQLNPNIVRPAGPTDSDVGIVLIEDKRTGKPFASLTVFAMHSDTVGGSLYSADYAYFLQQTLRAAYGSNFISAFAAGTCGDLNHINVNKKEPFKGFDMAEHLGSTLGQTVLEAVPKLKPVTKPSLAVRSRTLSVPLQEVTPEQLADARSKIDKLGDPNTEFMAKVAAVKILDLAQRGSVCPMEVQVFRLGSETAIVCLPAEIFVELGLAIKQASPFKNTIVISICNDRPSYVPTRKAFAEGSYEVTNSRVKPGAGEMLVEAAVGLLNDLKP